MFGNNAPFSYSPRGFSQEDLPQQRRTFLQDDHKGPSLQRNNMFRPSGKSIYMQRKEYSDTLNKQSDNFYVRVEHLFTCKLDGLELKTVDDCVAKLKRLDAKGHLWPQEMIMEAQGGYLLLSDIETKAELESMPLNCILQTRAVLDSCAYNSLLTITLQERNQPTPQVFMFQCEETGAALIKTDLDRAVQKGGGDVNPHRDQSDIRINLENIIGHHALGSFRQAAPRPVMTPEWREPENRAPSQLYTPEATMPQHNLYELRSSPDIPLSPLQVEAERNTDIFNHIINDLEIFTNKVFAAVNAPATQDDKKKKSKKKKKNAPAVTQLPPWEEYTSCLQKIKYGFNLLSQLDGILSDPTASDFVHIFFSSLAMIVPHYPADLPPTVVSPLLTVKTLRLLSQVVNPQEDNLWKSLGDSWNLPRSRWPDDVPPYTPEFYDGWQPPAPSPIPSPLPYQNGQISRNSQRVSPEPMTNGRWDSPLPPTTHPNEPPMTMRVIDGFTARNNQELSIMKGEVVQVIQTSRQWWLVRNNRGEEGNVPQNVLAPIRSKEPVENLPRDARSPVTLDMSSTPAEVKAWLEYKGFSKITVNSLGVLTGRLLLGMTKNEIRTVCPEEGGKVFFQLQGIKSAIALASEPSGMYNGRY